MVKPLSETPGFTKISPSIIQQDPVIESVDPLVTGSAPEEPSTPPSPGNPEVLAPKANRPIISPESQPFSSEVEMRVEPVEIPASTLTPQQPSPASIDIPDFSSVLESLVEDDEPSVKFVSEETVTPTPTPEPGDLNTYESILGKLSNGEDPKAKTMASATSTSSGFIKYVNQGAIRNKPLSNKLVSALSFLPEMGITMEVFSGGQEGKGEGTRRIGSTRHDHGNAADVFFYKEGRRLDWAKPDDLPIFKEIVRRARQNGVTGFGAGPGYMRQGSMHIGFGSEVVWGKGGDSNNAPKWLKEAAST